MQSFRRALLNREKEIYNLKAEKYLDSKTIFQLQLHTQAGVYIKEFCHGDLKRTIPNLGSLLKEILIRNGKWPEICSNSFNYDISVDILELDVINIDLIWPTEEMKCQNKPL